MSPEKRREPKPRGEGMVTPNKLDRKAARRAVKYLALGGVSTGRASELPRTFEALRGEFQINNQAKEEITLAVIP